MTREDAQRDRGAMAEDVEAEGTTVADFEEAFRKKAAKEVPEDGYWPNYAGIRIEEVRLEGSYPYTQVVRIFRRFSNKPGATNPGNPDCRFAFGQEIWPAEDTDIEEATRDLARYFDEALDDDSIFDRVWGTAPCDPERITWLTEPPPS